MRKKNNLSEPVLTEVVVGLVVLGAGGYVLKGFIEKQHEKNLLKYAQQQNFTFKGANVAGKKIDAWYGLNAKKIINVNLATIATDLNGALHPGWYIPTDQDRAVRVFLQTPAGMVKKLEDVYFEMFSENLKQTLSEKLSDVNFIKIKNYFTGKLYDWPGLKPVKV